MKIFAFLHFLIIYHFFKLKIDLKLEQRIYRVLYGEYRGDIGSV